MLFVRRANFCLPLFIFFLPVETLFASIQPFPWEQTRTTSLWSHRESKLLQMFANAACGCRAPAGTRPSNESGAEYLSAVAVGSLGSLAEHTWHTASPRVVARRSPLWFASVAQNSRQLSIAPRRLFADVFASKTRRWRHLHGYLSVKSHRSVFVPRGELNRFQKW